jgi:hypothetical protein
VECSRYAGCRDRVGEALDRAVDVGGPSLDGCAPTFGKPNVWRDRFAAVSFNDKGGTLGDRYFRDIAIDRVLEAIAAGRQRMLLTLATGTGKKRESLFRS